MQKNGISKCRQPVLEDTSSKSAINKTKRKSRWKLKFHHQALPPEYLNHYETTLQKQQQLNVENPTFSVPNNSTVSCDTTTIGDVSTSGATVRYRDLPYMGEMTLDNTRPRRGRKPKKADICHLIYKNYGTTVLEEPLNLCVRDMENSRRDDKTHLTFDNDLQSGRNTTGSTISKFKFIAGESPSLEEQKSVTLDLKNDHQFMSLFDTSKSGISPTSSMAHRPVPGNPSSGRKSRKSVAREKLEKTFKERGFLIQTQQLESAQGATYCKFRQLRKFTRYLFRSWKHHLPGDVMSTTPTHVQESVNTDVDII